MKITKTRLTRIIKEELTGVLREAEGNKIWLVWGITDYEGESLIAAFSSPERAEEFAAQIRQSDQSKFSQQKKPGYDWDQDDPYDRIDVTDIEVQN